MRCLSIKGKPSDLYDKNNPDWAPSLHLGGAPEPPSNLAQERYERAALISEKRRKASEAASQVTCCYELYIRIQNKRLPEWSFFLGELLVLHI